MKSSAIMLVLKCDLFQHKYQKTAYMANFTFAYVQFNPQNTTGKQR